MDCCRTKISKKTRGGEEWADGAAPLIITYACAPSKEVPARSTIATAFFERLREKANDATGEVTLPYALVGWRGTDKKAEVLPLTDLHCKL